jgi:hypothetical protein
VFVTKTEYVSYEVRTELLGKLFRRISNLEVFSETGVTRSNTGRYLTSWGRAYGYMFHQGKPSALRTRVNHILCGQRTTSVHEYRGMVITEFSNSLVMT